MRIRLALVALAALTAPAFAQKVTIVASCSTGISPTYDLTSTAGGLLIDQSGKLCIGASALSTTPTIANGSGVVPTPSAESGAGITPVVSAALESNHVIKSSAGNFYSGYITTGATAGWLLLANATSAPTAGGAAIAPLACVLAPANTTTSINSGAVPMVFSTGIVMVFSTSGCLTNTASTTAFFSGLAK